ncbi:MAG: proline iminopeptidase-family hydrolase [Dongiaceae bacterium]
MTAVLLDGSDVIVTGRRPDRMFRVSVEGGRVMVYVYGEGHDEIILCLNGGPGVASQYMRDTFWVLAERGYRVVVHDQLGTGASDRPEDAGLWKLRRYVEEVEAVRQASGGGRVHLLGHSWGGWLGIEHAVSHPDKLKSCIFSSTCANMPLHIQELRRLLSEFGAETLAMVDRLETTGSLSSRLYDAVRTLFYGRHSSRQAYLAGSTSSSDVSMQIQVALWGPAEFSATGELATWNRLTDLRRVLVPSLVLVGAYDYLTPRSAELIQSHFPNARLVMFRESGHAPHLDEPEAYFDTVAKFLDRVSRQ